MAVTHATHSKDPEPTAAAKAAEPAAANVVPEEDPEEAKKKHKKHMKLKHARVLAKDRETGGSNRFAAMRREKRAEKRKHKRPLSREEADSNATAVEDTVKELMGMGFDEAAARAAVTKELKSKMAMSSSAAEEGPAASAPAGGSKAKKRRKSSTGAAATLGAAIAPERTFNVWDAEQLDALDAAAAEQGLTDAKMDDRWAAVAAKVGNGRSASACRHRWAALKEGKGAPAPPAADATSGAAEADTADETAAAADSTSTWKSRKADSTRATKIFIGNAKALGGEDKVIQFFASADDADDRAGGMITELQWLSGKAEGSCFARCSSAAAAAAAVALSGTTVSAGQQLLVQMAHEVSFKAAVPKLKSLRGSDGGSGSGLGLLRGQSVMMM